jgi:predicted transcriptional regulator of viral defense system
MSIFNSNEGEMARFERHMKPIRAMNENKRLRLIRDQLRKDLQLQRKLLRAKKSEQALLEQELKSLAPLQLELPLKRPI